MIINLSSIVGAYCDLVHHRLKPVSTPGLPRLLACLVIIVLMSGCAATYGPEYHDLTDEQKWFVGPLHRHGDVGIDKPYIEVTFDDVEGLRNYCQVRPFSRVQGYYKIENTARAIPEIVYLEGDGTARLHELCQHYDIISPGV